MNRDIILTYLEEERFDVTEAEDGQSAWTRLSAGEHFDVVILDRMMPGMNGMELLEKMKGDPNLKGIPVIMQTAAAASERVAEGISSGVFYYLTKPFDRKVLLAIVRAALEFAHQRTALQREIFLHKGTIHLARSATFGFSTLEEARALAISLSDAAEDPSAAGLGLLELMVNAVEHGNLGMNFEEKVQFVIGGTHEQEIRRRMELPEHKSKFALVEFSREGADVVFLITDQGLGFDWRPFLELDPRREMAPCGRGIAMARMLAFNAMEYLGTGNAVRVSVRGRRQA
jgi:CheY-like chemotaxis protein